MKPLAAIAAFFTLPLAPCLAGLPAQDDVFRIASHTPGEHNLMSSDYIFSALPYYEEIADSPAASFRDYPSHKDEHDQQGVIVLKDKSVLFFSTRSAKYLCVYDAANRSSYYRLPDSPRVQRTSPKPSTNLADLAFPQPDEVFCVALCPWNKGAHFTPDSLTEALPRFRELTKDDVPATAGIAVRSESGLETYTPKEWTTPAGRSAAVLNGVIVLKNGAVLKWITWTPTAIAFSNYRAGSYYVLGPAGAEKSGPQ